MDKNRRCRCTSLARTLPLPFWIPAFAGNANGLAKATQGDENWTAPGGFSTACGCRPTPPLLDSSFRWKNEFGGRRVDNLGYFHSKDEFGSRTVDKGGHFRTNRSCRLVPAHQGIKIRTTSAAPLDSRANGALIWACRSLSISRGSGIGVL